MADPAPVVVVGGGLAGLAAAHALAGRDLPVRVLEGSDRFGGVVRSLATDGFLFETGPDAMLSTKPEGVALCRELGLADRLVPTNPDQRTVYVVHRGALHPMPAGMVLAVPTRLRPVFASGLFSWTGKLRLAAEPYVPRRAADGDESVASFVRRRLGREAWARLGDPLLGGIHAGDTERLSMRSTFPRLVEAEARQGSLVRAFRAAAAAPAEGSSAFVSLAGGLSELTDALVARLPASSLRSATPVRAVAADGTGWRVVAATGDAVPARAVIVALPPPRAAEVLEAAAPEIAAELSAIPFVSTAIVLLGFARDAVAHPLDGYGLIVPRSEGLRVTACGFFSTKFPGRAPAGTVALRAFLGSRHDPDALGLADDALVETALRELAPLLGLRGRPTFARVCRWPASTPQMELGHADRVARVEGALARRPGLFLAGAGLRVTGMPDTIADARRTASAAAAFLAGDVSARA